MPKKINITTQRQMITTAAISVINECGLDGARLRDFARTANVTTGAVTHYFDNKDAVLEATLEDIVNRTLKRMENTPNSKFPVDITTFISWVCRYLPTNEDSRTEWRVWLAFWGRAIADERLRTIHQKYYNEIVNQMAKLLQSLPTKDTTKNHKKVLKHADALIAAIDGIGTRATLEPELWPLKRQHETLTELLSPMLLAFTDNT